MIIIIIGTAAGIMLGMRFQLFVLVLLVLLGVFAAVAAGIASGQGVWPITRLALLIVFTFELGYLVGGFVRSFASGLRPALQKVRKLGASHRPERSGAGSWS